MYWYYTDSIAQNIMEKCMKNRTTSDEITCDITSNCAEIVDAEMSELIHDFVKMYSSALRGRKVLSPNLKFIYNNN